MSVVYVVSGQAGEYSNTHWWVTAVFQDRSLAEAFIAELVDEWKRVATFHRQASPHSEVTWKADDAGEAQPTLVRTWAEATPAPPASALMGQRYTASTTYLSEIIESKITSMDPRAAGCPLSAYGVFEPPTYHIDECAMRCPIG